MSDVAKADHGRLFDNFSRQASHAHGGSYYDSGFGQQAVRDAHGKLFDLFGVPKDSSGHGERFDEFGWNAMPAIHGQHFDSDFQQPTAHDTAHGTWFDAFRGGAEVRYMLDGADYEGTVIECNREYATVRAHDGQTHEVGLSQFLAYRTPNEHQASPATPASDAAAPSARSHDAHGNFGTKPAETFSGEMPPVIQEAPQGQATEPRSGVPEGIFDTFTRVKSLVDRYDGDDVAKDVDATETGVQGQPTVKTVGHRNNCPRGGSAPCGAAVDGRCSLCNAQVHDHDAVGKSAPPISTSTGDLGIEVPERERKSTDHHSAQTRPGRCPHCGKALDEVDHQTEQGQPTRTHKCLGTGLDVLKTLTEA